MDISSFCPCRILIFFQYACMPAERNNKYSIFDMSKFMRCRGYISTSYHMGWADKCQIKFTFNIKKSLKGKAIVILMQKCRFILALSRHFKGGLSNLRNLFSKNLPHYYPEVLNLKKRSSG